MAKSKSVPIAVLLVAVCLVVSSSAQSAGEQMIHINGRDIHVLVSGSGRATVVFVSGMGEDLTTWSTVQPSVSRFARTIAYDRAGLGKSPPAPDERNVHDMVLELHSLLRAAKAKPPFILVGHSLGGVLIEIFARDYPNEIAGLVLVDPEDSELIDRLRSHMSAADWKAREQAMEAAMPAMPAPVQAEFKAANSSHKYVDPSRPLPNVPMILLTGTKKNPEFPGNPLEQDLKLQIHQDFLTKVRKGKHVLVPTSRHYIQTDEPEIVISAIRELVKR